MATDGPRGRRTGRRRGIPWRVVGLATLIAVAAIAAIAPVRAWVWSALVLPVIADVLGMDRIVWQGTVVTSSYGRTAQVATVALMVLVLVGLRAALLERRARGARWAERVEIDGSLLLALTPFLVLGPVIAALEHGLLFTVPAAFFAVPPLLYLLIVGLALVSLLFGLWIEEGGLARARGRYVAALLVFLSFHLFAIAVLDGTTRRLSWWAPVVALAVSYLMFFGVTLGNRIGSHRRYVFSLGFFHVAFFAQFLVLWVLEGPWPAHDWSFSGVTGAPRILQVADPWDLFYVALPPVAIVVGFYTLGSFLHRYHAVFVPWVDGLNLALVFAHALDGWATTVAAVDPFDAVSMPLVGAGGLVAWATAQLGGWGYFVLKLVLGIVAVLAFDLPLRGRPERFLREMSHFVRGALVALALVPGTRLAIGIATGL